MTKRNALLCCTAIVAVAAIAACSSSTSPNPNHAQSPSSATKGQNVNLSGNYSLTAIVLDSTDGGTSTLTADANDGGTLDLTTSSYTVSFTGNFAGGGNNGSHGGYVATDTSSASQRGTLTLNDTTTSGAKTENAWYAWSTDSLVVAVPNNGSGGVAQQVTYWVKQ